MLPLRPRNPRCRRLGGKSKIFFWGAGGFSERFLGPLPRVFRAPGGFWGVERSIWGEKRPGFTRLWPGFAPKMGDNRPGFASQNPRFSDYVIQRRGWNSRFSAKFGTGFACRPSPQRRRARRGRRRIGEPGFVPMNRDYAVAGRTIQSLPKKTGSASPIPGVALAG